MLFNQSLTDKHLDFLLHFSTIACILQKCQGHIRQIKTEEYSRLKEVKMAACLKVMCHPKIYPGLVKSYSFNTELAELAHFEYGLCTGNTIV